MPQACFLESKFRLRQGVAFDDALRLFVNLFVVVAAAARAGRGAAFDVFVNFGLHEVRAGFDFLFKSPLFLRAVNLAEVVDASIALGSAAGFDEVGDRDGGEQADDRHNDHDFNECEP